MVICLERGADLHTAQQMPLPLTVSCFCKIQIGFTFLVPAHPGIPDKGPLNVCVCVCVFFPSCPSTPLLSSCLHSFVPPHSVIHPLSLHFPFYYFPLFFSLRPIYFFFFFLSLPSPVFFFFGNGGRIRRACMKVLLFAVTSALKRDSSMAGDGGRDCPDHYWDELSKRCARPLVSTLERLCPIDALTTNWTLTDQTAVNRTCM